MTALTRDDCLARDAADPLAPLAAQFTLPEGVTYLDGNSLGALPRATAGRLAEAVQSEWGQGLIRSWNTAGWIGLPQRVGDKIARLIGARPGEVVAADSTSINLFKVLAAALRLQAQRDTARFEIVSEADNFPTDLYIAEGLAEILGGRYRLKLVQGADVAAAIGPETAVVMLTQVNYRTGALHDMAALTARAHAAGALTIWDLAHSAGALPVDLHGARADFAIGCGYKYLNGGPGAPAFVWVHPDHRERFWQPLSGWMGHAQPFSFDPHYAPAAGIGRYLCGTPAVLAMTALECGVDSVLSAEPLGGMAALRAKSLALGELFMELVEARCADRGLRIVTPRERERRGSQVSIAHPDAFPIMQALIARGVIGDYRAGRRAEEHLLRFGFTPLYLRYADVWDAVETLRDILHTEAWRDPRYAVRGAVT